MKHSRSIIILSIFISLVFNVSGCGTTASTVDANQTEIEQKKSSSFFSEWLRDRSKDYVATEKCAPIQLRNKQVAENFNEDYQIPGE